MSTDEFEKLLDAHHAKALVIADKLADARLEIKRLKTEIGMAYKEGWTEGFACDGHAVYGFEGQRDADFEKSRAKRVMED